MRLVNSLKELLWDPKRPIWRVLFFGAAGGALGLVSVFVVGGTTEPWFPRLCAYSALGAGAALVGVFVLTSTDTQDVLRCCAVALLAGFLWQGVFDAGKGFLQVQEDRQKEKSADDTMTTLNAVTTKLETSPTDTALIKQGSDLAASLTEQVSDLRKKTVRTRGNQSVVRYLAVLPDRKAPNDIHAVEAAVRVAEVAERAGNDSAALQARQTLARIPVTTNATNPAFKLKEDFFRHRP